MNGPLSSGITRTAWLRRNVVAKLFALVLLAIIAFSLAATGWHPVHEAGERYVVDERGQRIALPQHIERVAVFMAIGVGEYVLVSRKPGVITTSDSAINHRIKTTPLLQKAFPDIVDMQLPMSTLESGNANLEVLLREKPDVLVTWARLADYFERVGLTVVGLGPVISPERLKENTRLFSAIVGEPERGLDIIRRSDDEQKAFIEASASSQTKPTSMLMLFNLGDGQWRIGYGFPELMRMAGAHNIGAGYRSIPVNAEELMRLSPEVIVIIGAAGLDDEAPRRLMSIKALQPVPAVRDRRVYEAPPGVTGYMGSVIEFPIYARWLADVLHPQNHANDVKETARRIYTRELGVIPDDGDLASALGISANRASATEAYSRPPR